MIVQLRRGGLRLFLQHDHALVSGELAAAWREAEEWPEVSEILVLASSLHDTSWQETDRRPTWRRATGRPFDFMDFPRDRKFANAEAAIDRIARLHPYAAVLVSLHYSGFGGSPTPFRRRQERRRATLLDRLGEDAPDQGRIDTDVALLRLFDLISLHICMTPPDAADGDRPEWLTGSYPMPGRERRLELRWRGPNELAVTPFPFRPAPLPLEIPFRDLEQTTFESASALRGAWDAAERRRWRLRVLPIGATDG